MGTLLIAKKVVNVIKHGVLSSDTHITLIWEPSHFFNGRFERAKVRLPEGCQQPVMDDIAHSASVEEILEAYTGCPTNNGASVINLTGTFIRQEHTGQNHFITFCVLVILIGVKVNG